VGSWRRLEDWILAHRFDPFDTAIVGTMSVTAAFYLALNMDAR
jgi:hypothetical protein